MKINVIILMQCFFCIYICNGQIKDSTYYIINNSVAINNSNKIKNYNLCKLWYSDSLWCYNYYTRDTFKLKRAEYLGFIGDNYQRFYIHFLGFKKSNENPEEYLVTGKTKVYNNICSFKGILNVNSIIISNDSIQVLTNSITNNYVKQGFITSSLILYEDSNELSSGKINGNMETYIYMDSMGNINFDCYQTGDGACNYQFEGNWTSYKTKTTLKCNWGMDRIPGTWNTLDSGAGLFWPNEKYLQYGWDSYLIVQQHMDENSERYLEALKKENEEWWK